MNIGRGSFLGAAVGAAIAVTFLHFWRLDSVHSGFFVDEAGTGYAAWGISIDGRDEHGVAWPLSFESAGDYKNSLAIHLIAAVVRVFGLSGLAIRSIPAALSLATAAVLARLAWELFRSRWLALAAFWVAGVLLWLLVLGRTGFEAAAQPFSLALFLLLWLRADRLGGWWRAVTAGAALGLSGYAYSTGRLFLPLLVLAMVAASSTGARSPLASS